MLAINIIIIIIIISLASNKRIYFYYRTKFAIDSLSSPFGGHFGKFSPPTKGLQRQALGPTSCSCPNECFSRGSGTTGTFSRALRHVLMCWPVWENPKGVTNLFNRNIKQAPSTCIWKEPAGETKRWPTFARMTPRFPRRNNLSMWSSSRRMRLSGGTRPPSPSQCQLTTSMNCLHSSPASPLGSLKVAENQRAFGVFSSY